MSDFDSSESENEENDDNYFQKKPFQYDYFLSNSVDVFQSWKNAVLLCSSVETSLKNLKYLELQFGFICRIDKFRTANVIRSNGFIYILRQAFQDVSKKFNKVFDSQYPKEFKDRDNVLVERLAYCKILQKQLKTLLQYLDVVLDQGLQQFYNEEKRNFSSLVFQVISKVFTFVTDPYLLGKILDSEIQLNQNETDAYSVHCVSLGGNHSYYQNIMRSLLKKNLNLKEIYQNLSSQLKNEKAYDMKNSVFLIKMISQVWNLPKDQKQQKDRRDFIDSIKGMYYLSINLRNQNISYQYIFSIFHLEHLETHRIFIDYAQLEQLYINLLKHSKQNSQVISLFETFSFENFPFQKRKKVPQIEEQTLDIVYNYIAAAKSLIGQKELFSNILPINFEYAYESSKYLLKHESVNVLVGLMMSIQENSKDAFSLGGIEVHKIYLRMSELLKQIYLSFQHSKWLFPTNTLLYISLNFFISISDDIKADVKKTLFQMVNIINQDRMPQKLIHREGKIVKQRVERAEYLQVILFFLQECRRQEEYINLPEIVPSNMQTSVLYVKSLQSKLNGKEPNEDQKPYFKNMLQFCQKFKVNIDFKWYQKKQTNEDRQIEFNIEKGLPQQWMRHIYRQTINKRQSQNIESYIQKYQHNKGHSILRLVGILKFNHGLNPADGIDKKTIRQQDLFLLIEQIRMILGIHFDIFSLNLDEEISLNYLHVCLGFYNNTIQQAPGNECYQGIMQRIMIPYLKYPNSTQSKFRTKYPGFFAVWIYSFQIRRLLLQLGGYIQQHAADQNLREDIIAKIKMVSEFLENKQNIQKSTSLEQLTQTVVIFSTLLNPTIIDPSVYLEGVELFCLFLNTFPAIKNQATLDFLFSPEVLRDPQLVDSTLAHIRKNSQAFSGQEEVSISNGLLKNLAGFMNYIGLKKSMEVLQTYIEIKKTTSDKNIDLFAASIFQISSEHQTFLSALFKFIMVLKKVAKAQEEDQAQENQKEKTRKKEFQHKMLIQLKQLQNRFKVYQKNQQVSMEGVLFTDLVFLDQIQEQLQISKNQELSQFRQLARSIFYNLLKNYGHNQDLMYFAQKLNMSDLILSSKKGESGHQDLLVDLIIENRHKQVQTELIKRLLRQNTKLSDVAQKAIARLSKDKQKIHSYHINRFIQINSRYPQQRIQSFLIEHIGCERNNSNAKIHQEYLINSLMKRLQKVPKNLCELLLLKPIKAQQKQSLIQLISDIFEQILYLPIKKFDKIDFKVVDEQPEDEDWNTQSENEDREDIQQTNQSHIKQPKNQKFSQQSVEEHLEQVGIQDDFQSDLNSQNYDDDCRPQFLQIFTEDQKKYQLKLYEQIMILRQELDVLIFSDYSKLIPGSELLKQKQIVQKLIKISGLMNELQFSFSLEMCYKMPPELYRILRQYGLSAQIEPQMQQKIRKRKEPTKQKPKWMSQYFSDRDESDDSNIVEDMEDEDNYEDRSQYSEEEDQYDDQDQDQEADYEDQHKRDSYAKRDKQDKSKVKKSRIEVPELLPTYSKIQKQINGFELKRQQLVKILQIALYLLLNLPESQIKSRHVTSFYVELLESNFGQMFLQSFMTVIRFDETQVNLQSYLKSIDIQKQSELSIGLQEISMQDAINNIIYLIKQYNQANVNKESYRGNILFKESGALLPIAQEMIAKFDLPLQNNCITLLLIYIETNKAKIRKKITDLNFILQGHQIANKKTQYKLKNSQITRIIQKICKQKSNNLIWETIEGKMNLKINKITKLFACIRGYGGSLYKKVKDTGQKIIKTIKNSEGALSYHHSDHDKQRYTENTYHIISKLILSCKEQIKQFYFINKTCLREIMTESEFSMDQIAEVKHVPKILLKNKDRLLKNKQLIDLCEIMIYFIKHLKDQFQGKIQDKMFSKLIHYPKMIIEASWFYVFLYARHQEYFWTSPSQIQKFFSKHSFVHAYSFSNLQEVFNLVIYFLNLESFCTDKFKQFFMPILMKNHFLAREISLRFKIPKIDEDVNTQNILVTRKCSFDMAFYQVIGQAITVEFYGEEGSDHGGLVRQLMIGWKGRGVGEQAFFIGKILGISFKQGVPYGGALDIGMFVAITNYTPTLGFFEEVDPEIYNSLIYVKDNDPTDLCLKFTVEKIVNGKLVQFQLIQGGRDIDLVQKNKHEYLEAYTRKYFFLGREKELQELRAGFNTVVFSEFAQIFTPLEMLKQIRGQQIVDVKMLINKAKYEGFSVQSPVIKWFWSIIESFDQQKMNMFIQFVTGSPKITVYNSNFSIVIEKVFDVNCLPVAHTCFNTLDLPEYSSRQILQKKLMTAISQGNNSFGIL